MGLSKKHEQFVSEYLTWMNATEAYSRAYPNCTRETARRNGHVLLTNTDIAAAIDARLAANAMNANEVLARLSEHAAGDMGDFWNIPEDGEPTIDLTSEKAADKLRLIKKLKVKTTRRTIPMGEDFIDETTTEVDFDIYDAQAALEKLGRYHKLFTDKTEIGGSLEIKNADAATERVNSKLTSLKSRIAAGAIISGDSSG
jgi:hypothetical protein